MTATTTMTTIGATTTEPARGGRFQACERDASDESLASRARAGDRASFGVLCERYEGRVLRLALTRLRDRHDAEEVAQETLMRAWRSIRTYREGEAVAPWVLAIARREIVNVVRRRQRSARDRERRVEPSGRIDGACDSGVWEVAREALSEEAYEAMWLRYAEGLEPSQIARVLGKTGVGVRVLLHRARRTMLAKMESEENGDRYGAERVAAREVSHES